MEQRGKRPRLDQMIPVVTSASNQLPENNSVAIATIGGHSYLINSNPTPPPTATGTSTISSAMASIPANILLTICDDHEAQQFLIDSALLDQIKQENLAVNVSTQTQAAISTLRFTDNAPPPTTSSLDIGFLQPQQRSQQSLANCTVYGDGVSSSSCSSSSASTSQKSSLDGVTLNTSTTALELANGGATGAAAMQLPADCEIYLVKEFLEEETTSHPSHHHPGPMLVESIMNSAKTTATTSTTTTIVNNIVKLEPEQKPESVQFQLMKGWNSTSSTATKSLPSLSSPVSSSGSTNERLNDEANKRSYILEAYKKRDDKRRATHNEVERRRRDKINNWIFKLKEMLPTNDQTTPTSTNLRRLKTLQQQQQQQLPSQSLSNSRTSPCDSKSQILIKACEYIKAMQEEIQSLRECLTENESLRLCNRRLEDELTLLRGKVELISSGNGNRNAVEESMDITNSNCQQHLMLESLDEEVHLYTTMTTTTTTVANTSTRGLPSNSEVSEVEEVAAGRKRGTTANNRTSLHRVDYDELDAIQMRDLLKVVTTGAMSPTTNIGTMENTEVRERGGRQTLIYDKAEPIADY